MATEEKRVEQRERMAPDARRAQLVEAGLRVLARDANWTIQAVADEAGVSEQLLYHYFPGGVLDGLVNQIAMDSAARISEFFGGFPTEAPVSRKQLRERVDQVVTNCIDWIESVPAVWLFGPERDRLSPTVGERWDEQQRAIAAGLARFSLDESKRLEAVVAVVYSELIAFQALAYEFKRGSITRPELEAAVSKRFELLFADVLPSLPG
ncbi:MAG: TetR/AcrR family transcriptional regulator [Actinomycetes bacterium]